MRSSSWRMSGVPNIFCFVPFLSVIITALFSVIFEMLLTISAFFFSFLSYFWTQVRRIFSRSLLTASNGHRPTGMMVYPLFLRSEKILSWNGLVGCWWFFEKSLVSLWVSCFFVLCNIFISLTSCVLKSSSMRKATSTRAFIPSSYMRTVRRDTCSDLANDPRLISFSFLIFLISSVSMFT